MVPVLLANQRYQYRWPTNGTSIPNQPMIPVFLANQWYHYS